MEICPKFSSSPIFVLIWYTVINHDQVKRHNLCGFYTFCNKGFLFRNTIQFIQLLFCEFVLNKKVFVLLECPLREVTI